MTLKYNEDTKLVGGFKISKVCLATTRFPYYLRHDNDGSIEWVSEDAITELLKKPKVKLPKFVANRLEEFKKAKGSLGGAMVIRIHLKEADREVSKWLSNAKNQERFARAWLDGYEVEEEKKYTVELKNANQILVYNYKDENYYFKLKTAPIYTNDEKSTFTKQELINAGFGGVFDNEMFEVEEVSE